MLLLESRKKLPYHMRRSDQDFLDSRDDDGIWLNEGSNHKETMSESAPALNRA